MPLYQDRHDQAILVLTRVKELLSDRNKWIAGSLAKNRQGEDVPADHVRAFRWCAMGAIRKVAVETFRGEREREVAEQSAGELLIHALNTSPYGQQDIPHVNDGLNGYERIMEGLAKAIGVSPKRRAAALKGWETRRQNQAHKRWLEAMEACSVDPRPEVMSFGGTIVAPPVADAKEVKTRVLA